MEKIYKDYNAAVNAAIRFFKKNNAVALIAGEGENTMDMFDDVVEVPGTYGFVVVVLSGEYDFTAPDAGPSVNFYYNLR